MSKALIIGGGAPNATLMSGALVAFIENGVNFDIISTSGAGALLGLLYQAPKGVSPVEALKATVDIGISDPIYNLFPVNYKVFQKPGQLADMYRDFWSVFPHVHYMNQRRGDGPAEQFLKDWMALVFATLCPSDLNANSLGLCANTPFVDGMVDFEEISNIDPAFYINAYNMTDGVMEIFSKDEITFKHFQAALSFPFLYPPTTIDGKDYVEGAVVDVLNYKNLIKNHEDVTDIVVFDIIGCDKMIQKPRNLFDSWVKSIINPLVEIARDDTKLFEYYYNDLQGSRNLMKVQFEIPEDRWPKILDWSHSNLKSLYDIGYEAGNKFVKDNNKSLNIS